MRIYAVAPGDRNVSWLAQCSRGWRFKPIKYLCALNSRVLSESTSADTEIKYIDISSVSSDGTWVASEPMTFQEAPSRARRILTDGDVLISTVRTYLRAIAHVEKVNDFLICSTGFAVLSAGKTVDSRFMAYWVRSKFFVDEVVSRSLGVSYPAINASDIGNLPLPVLPLSEQCSIAAFLDRMTSKIDALIDKKERLIELLQEKRAALISHVVTKGLDPSVPMKDSGLEWLGEIPEHWDVKRLKFIAVEPLKYGANESAELNDPELPRFIRITDIKDDGTLFEDIFKSLPEEAANSYLLKPGDILFARSGATVGKSFMYQATWGRACYAGYLIRLRINQSIATPEFLYYFINSSNYWVWLSSIFIQATIQNVSAEKYSNLFVTVPELDEQRAIVVFLDQETTKIDTLRSKIQNTIEKLKEYRIALISSAVTGKIDVRQEVA